MVLIEGVGDEVTIFAGVLLLLSVLLLAWISTAVVDRPLVSIIVLDGRTFQHFLARLRGRQPTAPTETTGGDGAGSGTSPDSTPTEGSLLDVNAATHPEPATEVTSETQSAAEPAAELPSQTQTAAEQGSSSGPVGEQETGRGDDVPVSGASTAASTPGSEGFVHLGGDGEHERTVPTQAAQSQCEPSGSELRQRRLAFFTSNTNQSDAAPQSSTQSSAPTGTPTSSQTQSTTTPDPEPPAEPTQSESTEDAEGFTHLDGHIRIRIKYLDDRQRWVQARPEETIGQFKRAHFRSELTENTMIRFIYNGRELTRDSQSLASYNISDESVIHCLVSRVNRSNTNDTPGGTMQFDVGSLLFPLFGLILALIWYSRFSYRQYFNTMSTLTLIAISFLFMVALLASFRTADHAETAEGD